MSEYFLQLYFSNSAKINRFNNDVYLWFWLSLEVCDYKIEF